MTNTSNHNPNCIEFEFWLGLDKIVTCCVCSIATLHPGHVPWQVTYCGDIGGRYRRLREGRRREEVIYGELFRSVPALYCTHLHCPMLFCTVHICTALCFSVLCTSVLFFCTVCIHLHCLMLHYTVYICSPLCYSVLYKSSLSNVILYFPMLLCTVHICTRQC